MNIFVSNLTAVASLKRLKNLFSEFGSVKQIMMIRESKTILPNIFCWVIMNERTDALCAIKNLDGSRFMQQKILVSEAVLIP